jgi:uncharacterized surface protein with fasciclin (FAS1) repeats
MLSLILASFIIAPLSVSASEKNIVQTAQEAEQLSTLVILVGQAGLVSALESDGPFTVFAPTNDAFAKMPKIVNKAIEKDPELLSKILLYHVVGKEILSTDIPRFTRVDTLSGRSVLARNIHGRVFINQSRVIAADIDTSNGIVHIIDRVLIPWFEVAKSLSKK